MAKDTFELTGIHAIVIDFRADGATLDVGHRAVKTAPFDCDIVAYSVVCVDPWDTPIDVVINIERYTFQGYPHTGESIVSDKPPTIVSGVKKQSTKLGAWDTHLVRSNHLVFSVATATNAKHLVITLYVVPS